MDKTKWKECKSCKCNKKQLIQEETTCLCYRKKRQLQHLKFNKKYRWSKWRSWWHKVWIKIQIPKRDKWWWWWKWWFNKKKHKINFTRKQVLRKNNWMHPLKNLVYKMTLHSCKWYKKICRKSWQKPKHLKAVVVWEDLAVVACQWWDSDTAK